MKHRVCFGLSLPIWLFQWPLQKWTTLVLGRKAWFWWHHPSFPVCLRFSFLLSVPTETASKEPISSLSSPILLLGKAFSYLDPMYQIERQHFFSYMVTWTENRKLSTTSEDTAAISHNSSMSQMSTASYSHELKKILRAISIEFIDVGLVSKREGQVEFSLSYAHLHPPFPAHLLVSPSSPHINMVLFVCNEMY